MHFPFAENVKNSPKIELGPRRQITPKIKLGIDRRSGGAIAKANPQSPAVSRWKKAVKVIDNNLFRHLRTSILISYHFR